MTTRIPIVLESFEYKRNFEWYKATEIFSLYLMVYDELDIINATKVSENLVIGGFKVTDKKFVIKIDGVDEDIFYLFHFDGNKFSLGKIQGYKAIIFDDGEYINMENKSNMHEYIHTFFENKQNCIELSSKLKQTRLITKKYNFPTLTSKLSEFRTLVKDEIENIYGDEFTYDYNSGIWKVDSFGFSIYATPFHDDIQGVIVDIVKHNDEETIYSGFADFKLTDNKYLDVLSYLAIIKESYCIVNRNKEFIGA